MKEVNIFLYVLLKIYIKYCTDDTFEKKSIYMLLFHVKRKRLSWIKGIKRDYYFKLLSYKLIFE